MKNSLSMENFKQLRWNDWCDPGTYSIYLESKDSSLFLIIRDGIIRSGDYEDGEDCTLAINVEGYPNKNFNQRGFDSINEEFDIPIDKSLRQSNEKMEFILWKVFQKLECQLPIECFYPLTEEEGLKKYEEVLPKLGSYEEERE